jgi:hypothetical protein
VVAILSAVNHPPILLGTSSFTAAGWNGSFYPKGMRPADYLAFYAEHFREFLEWTSGGHLRHARFVGLREDKEPREVVKGHAGES